MKAYTAYSMTCPQCQEALICESWRGMAKHIRNVHGVRLVEAVRLAQGLEKNEPPTYADLVAERDRLRLEFRAAHLINGGHSKLIDSLYKERAKLLVLIALMAQQRGLKVGIGIDQAIPEDDPESEYRSVLFIDLPAGQVSWHLHDSDMPMFYFVGAYDGEWDEHTTEEKYRRVIEPGL